MKKIRKGVFETNSSSTHSICIAKNVDLTIPKSIHFQTGDYGWENDTLSSIQEKASYLYTGLINNYMIDEFNYIVEVLKNKNIDVTYDEIVYKTDDWGTYYVNGGSIDHGYELKKFLVDISSSEDKILNFLFSPLSFIITGNDNDEVDTDINVNYEHDEYYKGN